MIELLTWATPNGARPAIMLEEVGRKTRLREALGTTPGIDGWLKEINARDAVQRGLRASKIVLRRNAPHST